MATVVKLSKQGKDRLDRLQARLLHRYGRKVTKQETLEALLGLAGGREDSFVLREECVHGGEVGLEEMGGLDGGLVQGPPEGFLAALETIESGVAERKEAPVMEVAEPIAAAPTPAVRARPKASRIVEGWRRQRALVAAYFLGPALINTAILLGLADSLRGIAFYTFLSAYAILTHR